MTGGVSIIAPCYNEQDNVSELYRQVVASFAGADLNWQLVLVDDASTDSTWTVLETLQASDPDRILVVQNRHNIGMFESWKRGLSAAKYDTACLIDADLQNPPGEVLGLLDTFKESRADLVQGVRSSIERHRDSRFLASRGLNLALNVAFSDRAQDNKSGFILGPRNVLQRVLSYSNSYNYPQTFIRASARSLGYSIHEQETLFRPRHAGSSFLADTSSLRIYWDVLRDFPRAMCEFGRRRRHPTESLTREAVPEVASASPTPRSAAIRRHIYFSTMPLHAWLIRKSARDYYEWLEESQWLGAEDMQTLQFQRLSQLIWNAYHHVPYYRRRFRSHGFHPSDLRSLEDLGAIPLLEKNDVRSNLYMGLFSEHHNKRQMLKIATSGSTGEPFTTYADRQQLEVRFASTLRSLEWTGWRFGDPQLRLWHQRLGMSRSQAIRERLDAALLRRTFVPAFELTETGMRSLARTIERVQPVLMDGYAESLNFISMYLASGGKIAARPRAVMSSAQTLTSTTRTQLETNLGAEVFDKYGAREFSGIAYECEAHDGHHVLDESYVVEVLRDGRPAMPGEVGEVVITDLNNFSVPLIRYRIGDLAVAMANDPCSCGRGLSRIGEIQGRTQALVHCANGRWLPGTFFAHFFKDYDYLVSFYQVLQDSLGSMTLRIVKGPLWSSAGWDDLIVALREYVGDSDIAVEYVEEIPLLATGKRTPVVSSLRTDFQSLA